MDGINKSPRNAVLKGGGTVAKGTAVEPQNMASKTSLDPSHLHHTKMGHLQLSFTESHAVPGKSSTDGTSSTAGRTGNLSLDALAKAKKCLANAEGIVRKDEEEISLLNKGAHSKQDGGFLVLSKAPSSVILGEAPKTSTLRGTATAPTPSAVVLTTPNI